MTAREVLTFDRLLGRGPFFSGWFALPARWPGMAFGRSSGASVRRRGCADLVAGLPWFPGHAALYIVEGCTH